MRSDNTFTDETIPASNVRSKRVCIFSSNLPTRHHYPHGCEQIIPKWDYPLLGLRGQLVFVLGAVVNKTLRTHAHRKLVHELRAARREAGLSQQQVAELLGVPQSYVAKIELGERRIDVIEFLKLVAVMDGSWFEILGRIDPVDQL